jgi:hypothetical protein
MDQEQEEPKRPFIAPSVMLIEVAATQLVSLPPMARASQLRELQNFGEVRARSLGATGLSPDFRLGYELGLQTARMYLSMNPVAVQAGIKL